MYRARTVAAAATVAAILAASAHTLLADVRADQKTHVEFAGMLGRMVNLFGGKAAREGVTSSVAVKGDRKATLNDQTGQIIDLAEEKVYDLDLRKKTYKVTTFDALRRKMEEAQKRADDARRQDGKAQPAPSQNQDEKQVEIDVDIKNTGQTRTINGFNTKESIVTITVREKGKTLEQGGGMVMTTDSWLAPRIAAMKEVADFEARYAQKLYGSMFAGGASAEQMAAAMAMYPMMKQAMGRMTTEGAKLDGTAILSTTTIDAVKSQEQMAQEARQKEDDSKPGAGGGVGGLLGGLAKKAAARKAGGDDTSPRATIMTSTLEILKVTTDVTAADVAIPVGFKESR
jgi:hypothetical protein